MTILVPIEGQLIVFKLENEFGAYFPLRQKKKGKIY